MIKKGGAYGNSSIDKLLDPLGINLNLTFSENSIDKNLLEKLEIR